MKVLFITHYGKTICQNITTANTTLDNYTAQGTYYFSTNYTPVDIPAGSNGWLIVLPYTSSVCKQIWLRHGTGGTNDHQTYVRTKTGGVWGEWTNYLTPRDIDATPYMSVVYTPEKYIDSILFRRKGSMVELYFGKTTEAVDATLGTVKIGTVPEGYLPVTTQMGVIIATLSGIPIYIGISTSGTISVRFCGSIASAISLYGRFQYIGL